MTLEQWAALHRITPQALHQLRQVLAGDADHVPADNSAVGKLSETAVAQRYRLAQSRLGVRLWRNNTGALYTDTGRLMRFGLANESAAMSKALKSGDYIGITPHVVTPTDVGRTLGIFTSREIKRQGWRYTGIGREVAQLAWIQLVVSLGGLAGFVDGSDNST